MKDNLEDFLKEDLWNYFNHTDDAEEEYKSEFQDAFGDEMNDIYYYGRYVKEVTEDEEEIDDNEDNETKNYILNDTKTIGNLGEKFTKKYLEELFEINDVNFKVKKPDKDNEKHDLEIYRNGEEYLIEVKTSTKEEYPQFEAIHFNNNFKYLLLVWFPNDKEVYLAILTKEEAKTIATPMNTNREDEDNWKIHTIEIFDENFLNRLSIFLELNKELEDLENNEKIELLTASEEEIMKNPNAVKNDFSGEVYQEWLYQYLSNYVDEVELMPDKYKYDIKYKGKGIEVKYSAFNKEFLFRQIKPENFEFILFISFDKENKKFCFEIKNRDEMETWFEEHGTNYQRNGNEIHVGKSFFRFGNDFDFEDFDNYIETH